jgi:N-acetylated-alpha-linked acidic dipeptidase
MTWSRIASRRAAQPAGRCGAASLAACVAALACAGLVPAHGPPIPGFSPSGAAQELRVEEALVDLLDAESTARHFRYATEEPHPAGSERNRRLARYTRDRFVDYGLEQVEVHEYQVLLPLPREVRVTMLEPRFHALSLREDGYELDKDSWADEVGSAYAGMSASGDVVAEVVYAHSGNAEDYDWLESQGIDPAGKIAIVRYSQPYSYRGFKAWEAERRGVAALLIYSDPMEDGYRRGDVFPHGPWGPESHIQRGAISYDFLVPGDPLTPGWPSLDGAPRLAREEARSIPGIVAVPLSWRDARPILESLAGPLAPYAWQGGLPIPYRVGPGPAKVRVRVVMDDAIRPIQVVTGRIAGAEEPDQWVVLGNHRDAWVYGAVDPSSGSASLLEVARILGTLKRQGHRPRRSLVLASWDAEEWHLTGSTEWGEHFAEALDRGALAYLNVDSATSGPDFEVSAVASLNPLIESVARDVIDPNTRRSLLEAWRRRRQAQAGREPAGPLVENALGSGSDYTVFLNRLGIPIIEMTFDGPYGVYHSQYDDYYWMTRFGDPGFRYMTAMVEVWGRMALRLANAEVVPYDFRPYAAAVAAFLDELAELPGASRLDLSAARRRLADWELAAAALQGAVTRSLAAGRRPSASRYAELNRTLLRVEREFLVDAGIPGRPWFKHVLYAPRYTYAALPLPGVREAAEAGDWERARVQLDVLASELDAVAELTRRAEGEVP